MTSQAMQLVPGGGMPGVTDRMVELDNEKDDEGGQDKGDEDEEKETPDGEGIGGADIVWGRLTEDPMLRTVLCRGASRLRL